jgi:hypothetical protein
MIFVVVALFGRPEPFPVVRKNEIKVKIKVGPRRRYGRPMKDDEELQWPLWLGLCHLRL